MSFDFAYEGEDAVRWPARMLRRPTKRALLNAMAFHFGIEKKLVDWDSSPETPRAAKLAGLSSMTLWAIVIVFGRFIAYNWFAPL